MVPCCPLPTFRRELDTPDSILIHFRLQKLESHWAREEEKGVERAVFHFYLMFSSFGNLNLIFAVTHPTFSPGQEVGLLEVKNLSI